MHKAAWEEVQELEIQYHLRKDQDALLELNRKNELDDETRTELSQFEQAELLMRLVKARVRANLGKDMPPR